MYKGYTKKDRLKSGKTIARLFGSDGQLFQYPIKIFYIQTPDLPPAIQMGVSVPKKKFKKATDRNTLKRRIREAYRLHRPEEQPLTSIATMWVYIGKEEESYDKIARSVKKLWQQLIKIQPHGGETQ